MFFARLLIWLHKIDMADTKCAGEFEQRHDCRVAPSALEVADVLLGEP